MEPPLNDLDNYYAEYSDETVFNLSEAIPMTGATLKKNLKNIFAIYKTENCYFRKTELVKDTSYTVTLKDKSSFTGVFKFIIYYFQAGKWETLYYWHKDGMDYNPDADAIQEDTIYSVVKPLLKGGYRKSRKNRKSKRRNRRRSSRR
jgi:hypothetical protein